jgi:hypothetical protein
MCVNPHSDESGEAKEGTNDKVTKQSAKIVVGKSASKQNS